MRLIELIFREVNVVLVHTGVPISAISLDRLRLARPASNIQVSSGPMAISVAYPDEQVAVQLDSHRITASDTAIRPPDASPIVEAAQAQHLAIGSPRGVAFGYNVRFEFRVEGLDRPDLRIMEGTLRNSPAVGRALGADDFQLGMKLIYQRGVKAWTLLMEPLLNSPERLLVHANVHENLHLPSAESSESPPPPAWMEEGSLGSAEAGYPSIEIMKSDIALQTRQAMETVVALLSLP